MIGPSYFVFIAIFVIFILHKNVKPTITGSNYQAIENRVFTYETLTGLTCKSQIICAYICEKTYCCSAKFNVKDDICVLTPHENCFGELVPALEEGWVTMMRNRKQELFTMKKNWLDAQSFCMSKGGSLTTIRNAQEYEGTIALIKGQNLLSTVFWVGATDIQEEGVFVWEGTSGKVVEDRTFWNTKQPDNGKGIEHCLGLHDLFTVGDFKFNDASCYNTYAFICEFTRF